MISKYQQIPAHSCGTLISNSFIFVHCQSCSFLGLRLFATSQSGMDAHVAHIQASHNQMYPNVALSFFSPAMISHNMPRSIIIHDKHEPLTARTCIDGLQASIPSGSICIGHGILHIVKLWISGAHVGLADVLGKRGDLFKMSGGYAR